ncbi:uncharacterized protein LOC144582772 isoform X1 [Callithrix jacchus]
MATEWKRRKGLGRRGTALADGWRDAETGGDSWKMKRALFQRGTSLRQRRPLLNVAERERNLQDSDGGSSAAAEVPAVSGSRMKLLGTHVSAKFQRGKYSSAQYVVLAECYEF